MSFCVFDVYILSKVFSALFLSLKIYCEKSNGFDFAFLMVNEFQKGQIITVFKIKGPFNAQITLLWFHNMFSRKLNINHPVLEHNRLLFTHCKVGTRVSLYL